VKKNTLSTGKQIIRSKSGFIAMRVSTLMTKDQERAIQFMVDELEAKVEAEFTKRASEILGIEVKKL
jgi:ATP phosphoribosyltransferase